MEKETIKENNKLIAEFMGGHVVDEIFICNESTESHNERCLHHYNISQAKYHSSWDWLMPVVEKCYSMDEYFKYKEETERQFYPSGIELSTKIESVWLACVEFIKWYNKQCK